MQRKNQNGLRRLLRWAWIYILYCSGLIAWARGRIVDSQGVVVLTLHRVLEDLQFEASSSPPGMIVRRSSFESMLEYMRSRFDLVSLREETSPWVKGSARPKFVITFDDGWKDTRDVAFLVAQRFAVPITVFICPGLLGRASPFWPEKVVAAWRFVQHDPDLRARFLQASAVPDLEKGDSPSSTASPDFEAVLLPLKRLTVQDRERVIDRIDSLMATVPSFVSTAPMDATMSWEDVSYLYRQGAQIGSHTQNHHILTGLSPSEAESELTESRKIIEKTFGADSLPFAYPNGSWSQAVRDMVVLSGYRLAFTTDVGVWTSDTDSWLIPRVNIWEGSILGPNGQFSPIVFEYAVFWLAHRTKRRKSGAVNGMSRQVQVL